MFEKQSMQAYHELPSPEEEAFAFNRKKKTNKIRSCLVFALKAIVIALAVCGTFLLYHQSYDRLQAPTKPVTKTPVICNCGNSIAEAKTRDCKFDSLATAWLPAGCRDDELTAEFEKSGPLEGGAWPYYKDLRMTHLLTVEDLANMADSDLQEARGRHADATYYTTAEWFVARCLFYWRKMERAETRGTTIERSFLDTSIDGHNVSNWHHCANVYLKRTPRDQIATYGVVGFGDPM
ncbi:hypothetical protein MMC17_004282 [Xylographa soralifera]|nr:hypothetical protein [Xylographa soralifera]